MYPFGLPRSALSVEEKKYRKDALNARKCRDVDLSAYNKRILVD